MHSVSRKGQLAYEAGRTAGYIHHTVEAEHHTVEVEHHTVEVEHHTIEAKHRTVAAKHHIVTAGLHKVYYYKDLFQQSISLLEPSQTESYFMTTSVITLVDNHHPNMLQLFKLYLQQQLSPPRIAASSLWELVQLN